MERKAGSSIQHQLTKIKYITFCKEVEADIESESVHWFRWHKGHGGDSQAGHWLNVILYGSS